MLSPEFSQRFRRFDHLLFAPAANLVRQGLNGQIEHSRSYQPQRPRLSWLEFRHFCPKPLCLPLRPQLGLSRNPLRGGRSLTTVLSSVEDDFYGWLIDQAAAVTGERYDWLEWKNLSEDLQAAARSLEQDLEIDLEVLLTYLLRWRHEPQQRGGTWQASIQNARASIADRLKDSPRLARKLTKLTRRAYRRARRSAGARMNLSENEWEQKFPHACPWNPRSFIGADFWPKDHLT